MVNTTNSIDCRAHFYCQFIQLLTDPSLYRKSFKINLAPQKNNKAIFKWSQKSHIQMNLSQQEHSDLSHFQANYVT